MPLARSLRIVAIALRNFRRARLQASLAILAAIVGTGGVIVCTGYASAGRQKIVDQLQRLGSNLVIVTPQQSRAVGGRARTGAIVTTLREPDYRAILAAVPEIDASSPTAVAVFRIRAGDLTKSTTIVGCTSQYFAMRNWSAQSGMLFDNATDRTARRVVLLGSIAARDLFGPLDPTGRRISINRVPFLVGGVLAERGQGLDAANEDAQVYLPLETAMRRLMNVNYYTSVLFQIHSWQTMDPSAQAIADVLGRRHRFVSLNAPDFQVQNQRSLIETQLAAYRRLNFFLSWIAASTLMVTSLGIFGVSWIGVGQRAREIGACRAIGATGRDVLTQFFVESIAGPALGCGVGVAVAWPVLRALDLRAQQPFLFSARMTSGAALFSILVYCASTIACCYRAIRIDPSVALRSE
jgi:putative ABC transport system permease protein